jgi:hypothetical protein
MKTSTVPRLNLAPKRRKPLSLLNPLDYLQLLSWVFFFPQALRWYTKTFGETDALNSSSRTWQALRFWWNTAPVRRNFLLQGLFAIISVSLATGIILNEVEIPINESSIVFSVFSSLFVCISLSIIWGVEQGISCGIAYCFAANILGLSLILEFRQTLFIKQAAASPLR